jgi:hypothetical protein
MTKAEVVSAIANKTGVEKMAVLAVFYVSSYHSSAIESSFTRVHNFYIRL